MLKQKKEEAIKLLKQLIQIQSFSTQEQDSARQIADWFANRDIPYQQANNNIWAINQYFDATKPTLLLNSHHDTVRPNKGYTRNPFEAKVEAGKLYGLGSNDAGGALVSLLTIFENYYAHKNLSHNLVMVASAEEEISGKNGLSSLLNIIPKIDVALVGEPTQMQMAVGEKGLIVLDAKIYGTSGHVAHPNNNNAIYNAIEVLQWFKDYQFEKESDVLGKVNMNVTQINAGTNHNVFPALVNLVIDVRVNDCYTNQEIAKILAEQSPCDEIKPRSLRLNSSSIPLNHDLVEAGKQLNLSTYGSPTLSDQALLSCPSLKMGPGDSKRSHSADEFIYIREIEEGIDKYIALLDLFLL